MLVVDVPVHAGDELVVVGAGGDGVGVGAAGLIRGRREILEDGKGGSVIGRRGGVLVAGDRVARERVEQVDAGAAAVVGGTFTGSVTEKSPARLAAVGRRTAVGEEDCDACRRWYPAKAKSLLRMMGPPKVPPNWFWWRESGTAEKKCAR